MARSSLLEASSDAARFRVDRKKGFGLQAATGLCVRVNRLLAPKNHNVVVTTFLSGALTRYSMPDRIFIKIKLQVAACSGPCVARYLRPNVRALPTAQAAIWMAPGCSKL